MSDDSLVPIASALGSWSSNAGPLYKRLAAAIRGAIESGALPHGETLPPERKLAQALAVSRGTVVAAYDSLREVGLIESRQGSGSRVRGGTARRAPASPYLSRMVASGGPLIDLSKAAVPLEGPDLELAADLDPTVLREAGYGYLPLGLPALRAALAEWLTEDGLPTEPEQVLVTCGAQEAISLIADGFVGPGDQVVVESPTYPNAIESFTRVGGRLQEIPLDYGGMRVTTLRQLLERFSPRVIYTIPTVHNPAGTVMPLTRRQELVSLARANDAILVDDGTMAQTIYEPHGERWLASLDPRAEVVTVGSFSKLFWGGLRVGWLRAAPSTVLRLGRIKAAWDLGTSLPAQALALRVLEDLPAVLDRRRALLRRRLASATAVLAEHLADWAYAEPRGGMALWLQLPGGGADELAQVAARYGVSFLPGPSTSPSGAYGDYVRLAFGCPEPVFATAVERLAAAFAEYRERRPLGGLDRAVLV
jgi:DNA-binding transcriptional MocR family regulator